MIRRHEALLSMENGVSHDTTHLFYVVEISVNLTRIKLTVQRNERHIHVEAERVVVLIKQSEVATL